MTSPHGGVAGPNFTDADFRKMIAKIIASPSPKPGVGGTPGPNSFQQEQAKLKKYYGASGGWWPEPGLSNWAKANGVPDDAHLKLSVMNEIEENYKLATTGQGTVLPHEDPGAAQAGIGPLPNPLAFLSNLWAILSNPNTWLRIGEFLLGAILVGVGAAKISSGAQDVILKYAPAMAKLVK